MEREQEQEAAHFCAWKVGKTWIMKEFGKKSVMNHQ